MTLAARLSAFFLVALAVVLGGFSAALYLLARAHLHRQADERLAAALETLAAAVEFETDGLEWEPQQRRLSVGHPATPRQKDNQRGRHEEGDRVTEPEPCRLPTGSRPGPGRFVAWHFASRRFHRLPIPHALSFGSQKGRNSTMSR